LGEIDRDPFEVIIQKFLGGTEENRETLSIAGYQDETQNERFQNASANLFNALALLTYVVDFSYSQRGT
jgi:hypothetical protein